eukprot:gene4853-6049_t
MSTTTTTPKPQTPATSTTTTTNATTPTAALAKQSSNLKRPLEQTSTNRDVKEEPAKKKIKKRRPGPLSIAEEDFISNAFKNVTETHLPADLKRIKRKFILRDIQRQSNLQNFNIDDKLHSYISHTKKKDQKLAFYFTREEIPCFPIGKPLITMQSLIPNSQPPPPPQLNHQQQQPHLVNSNAPPYLLNQTNQIPQPQQQLQNQQYPQLQQQQQQLQNQPYPQQQQQLQNQHYLQQQQQQQFQQQNQKSNSPQLFNQSMQHPQPPQLKQQPQQQTQTIPPQTQQQQNQNIPTPTQQQQTTLSQPQINHTPEQQNQSQISKEQPTPQSTPYNSAMVLDKTNQINGSENVENKIGSGTLNQTISTNPDSTQISPPTLINSDPIKDTMNQPPISSVATIEESSNTVKSPSHQSSLDDDISKPISNPPSIISNNNCNSKNLSINSKTLERFKMYCNNLGTSTTTIFPIVNTPSIHWTSKRRNQNNENNNNKNNNNNFIEKILNNPAFHKIDHHIENGESNQNSIYKYYHWHSTSSKFIKPFYTLREQTVGREKYDLKPYISPHTTRELKPYIRRDFETVPPKLQILQELYQFFIKNNIIENTALAGEIHPIDYRYLTPELVDRATIFLTESFWPGIDLHDVLEYPDFTVCALYRSMVIGCGIMNPDGYIMFISVHPEWQGYGIASFMLYHLTQTMIGRDITLHVSANNLAMTLYQKFGFKPEEYIVNFYNKYYSDESGKSKNAFLLLIGCIFIDTIKSQSSNCPGQNNPFPIYTDTPVFVTSTQNGQLFTSGPASNTINVLHLYGNPYDMGVAHGQLLQNQIQKMIPEFMSFASAKAALFIQKYQSTLPPQIITIFNQYGVDGVLDYVAQLNAPFTQSYFFEELKGLAEGSGLSYDMVLRMHMFPELIKATCSIVGAWGGATTDGGLIQLRALDWGVDAPLIQYPTVIVYHPEEGNGHPFSVLSWSGFIGALTGYSQYTGVSQKVWLKYNGTYSYEGIPFYFNLRNILQYDTTMNDAINRVQSTNRTCSVFLGIGSNSTSTCNVVEYSHDYLTVFNDQTPFPGYAPSPSQHPIIKNVVYVDKHSQPSTDPCLGSLLQSNWGTLSPQAIINIASQHQTGDLHSAVYDFEHNQVYVSVATTPTTYPTNQTITPSYTNQFIQLDMNVLLNLELPQ